MSAEAPTPEQRVERVKAALAEAGWPDVDVWLFCGQIASSPTACPPEVWWRACALVDPDNTSCWPCWEAFLTGPDNPRCDHDPRTSPWPPPPQPPCPVVDGS